MEFFAHHAGTPDLLRSNGKEVRALVRIPERVDFDRAWLRTEPDNEELLTPLVERIRRDGFVWLEAPLHADPAADVTRYAFKFVAGREQYWLCERGIERFVPERHVHFRWVPSYRPATWVWRQVFYQIFVDRFRDGDPTNNPRPGEWKYLGEPIVVKDWGELPDRSQGAREFYGGDLDGVVEALDLLQDLGVTALYLNPVFASPSSHKYDTVDFERVDPHFGGDEALVRLRRELDARRMRLILDAVVNHTSERHPWFDRYGEHGGGAYGNADAATRDFYAFTDPTDPNTYVGWLGVPTLPVLDYATPGVQQAVYDGADAILRRWLRPPFAADGWRFDVVHMIGEGPGAKRNHHHVRAFRRAVREESSQAYVLGELTFEAERWLRGDQLDGAMNYFGFTSPLLAFLAGVDFWGHPVDADAEQLDRLLTRARAPLPFPIQLSQLNLLDSHDTPRMLTRLGGDRKRMLLAAAALFTYIGVPCVYYGDEIGMQGGADPDCRRTFPWNEPDWDHELRRAYRSLARLRTGSAALQRGACRTLLARGDVYAYARVLRDEVVIVILNRGEATEVGLRPGDLSPVERYGNAFGTETFTLADGYLQVPVDAVTARVLVPR